ncbi:MAG: ATP-binding protein [Gammaproteobacteria bacterium]
MTPSIRTFLLINLLLSATLVTSFAIIGNLFLEHRDLQSHLDLQLLMGAHNIQAFLSSNPQQYELDTIQAHINHPPSLNDLGKSDQQHAFEALYQNIQFQVWNKQGQVILHSFHTPEIPLSNTQIGFTKQRIKGQPWRILTSHDPQTGLTVAIAQRYDFREELEGRIIRDSIIIMLLTYPALGLLIWLIVGRGLESIRKVASEVKHRAPTYLEPVSLHEVPSEIKPLVDELNHLFIRLHNAFDREKRFAADAAHELRTPLAGLKTQAQVALKATNNEERKAALEKVIVGVDRSTHVVHQLLILSRMVPEALDTELTPVNLVKQATDVIADLVPEALKKDTDIELVAPDTPVMIKGSPVAISILLRNLVHNAIHYTPPGSFVKVVIHEQLQGIVVKVIDNGPGIPEELRERVFERFFRILGSRATGSGLGLGIVQQVAEVHNAQLSLGTPENGKGLEVTVIFPKPANEKQEKSL